MIGTASPSNKLHVAGDAQIDGNIYAWNLPTAHTVYADATTANQWARIARVTLDTQYQSYTGQFTILSQGGSQARGFLRIVQNDPLGSSPEIELSADSTSTKLKQSDVMAVTTTNDASKTVVDLFIRTPAAWDNLTTYPFDAGWFASTDYTFGTFLAALPAGTQTSTLPGMSYWSLGSSGSSINYAGNVGHQ